MKIKFNEYEYEMNSNDESPATSGTSITENHNRGGGSPSFAAGPALAQIRAPSFFANSVELQFPQLPLDLRVLLSARDRFLHPFGLGEGLLLGPDLNGVIVGGSEADEVGERRGLVGEAVAESL